MDNSINLDSGQEVVAKFLDAVRSEDVPAFWSFLDKLGRGYFLGMWFMALEVNNVSTVAGLSEDKTFLTGALGPLVKSLKDGLGELLHNPVIGQTVLTDEIHARVPVLPATFSNAGSMDEVEPDYIPLVMELTPGPRSSDAEMSFTCWKIESLNLLQLTKD
ncbi:MAG: hypothetical protein K6U74_06950 [Firmicutes bacterium]|nr:hypothetical protein [Bacillota bacterium]